MKTTIEQKHDTIAVLLQNGDQGALRLGYAAAGAFEKAPKKVAMDLRRLVPIQYFPIILAILIKELKGKIGMGTFSECFPEHHQLLRGIMACHRNP